VIGTSTDHHQIEDIQFKLVGPDSVDGALVVSLMGKLPIWEIDDFLGSGMPNLASASFAEPDPSPIKSRGMYFD
jgi:hypothetical protein